MDFASRIEKRLGRKLDFKKDIILKTDSSGNTYIHEWNLEDIQPTVQELTDTYNTNKTSMEIDAKLKVTPYFKVLRIDGANDIVIGYPDTVDITSAEWENWKTYITSLSQSPTRLDELMNSLPVIGQDGTGSIKSKKIIGYDNIVMDASATVWLFDVSRIINAYLPDSITCPERVYYIKNTGSKTVYFYPTSGQKIDGSNILSVSGGRACELFSNPDGSGWIVLQKPA